MIYIAIILTIATFLLGGVVFFLFAIWRAILGKSSVDLKLATSFDINSKKVEVLTKNLTNFESTISGIKGEIKGLSKNFESFSKTLSGDDRHK